MNNKQNAKINSQSISVRVTEILILELKRFIFFNYSYIFTCSEYILVYTVHTRRAVLLGLENVLLQTVILNRQIIKQDTII